MPSEAPDFYEFAHFRLDRLQKILLREGKPVPLTPKVYDTLELLLDNRDRLLEKDELMQRLWPDRFVEESNLTSNIKMLRRALADDAADPRFIETVPRRGYRFICNVISSNDIPSTISSNDTAEPAKKRYMLISVTAILIVAIFGIAFMWVDGDGIFRNKQPKFARLTTTGKVTNATLVPDGKSIIYAQKEGAGESLWLREIESGQQRQILPPQDAEFVGLTASPDGNFAYYSAFSQNAAVQTLARVPLDGGPPQAVPDIDTDVSVSFSPDGKRFAYTDTRSSLKETTLKIADSDGRNQRILIKTVGEDRIFPFFRASPVAWSPDGATLACAIQEADGNGLFYRILLVDPETEAERYLSTRSWAGIENLVWQDAENLAFIEVEQNSPVRRIWQVSRTSGEAHQLTSDLNGYQWLSSAGGRLVTLQKNVYSSLHVASFDPDSNSLQPKQIFGESGVIESVGWSRDEKIFYNSVASGKNEVWQINADGTSPRQLTSDSNLILSFTVSPANDSLVFSSIRNGKISLVTANADGQSLRPLTDGSADILPAFSPNGADFVFQRGTSPPTLWSGTLRNDQLVQLTGYQATNPTFSPDGKQITFHFMDYGGHDPHWKLG
ncbi:MAG TPA: winged helix-turn-helix domain-containing protein, partial [Pyrinomonadaceae bacterium]|nr:winged helix-turn-helix domain-containing protein [Pyrinomonadaceae bacterium]